jgi:PKD repeat protein
MGPSISADGGYVAFSSWASNLVLGDTNGSADVFGHGTANTEGTPPVVGFTFSPEFPIVGTEIQFHNNTIGDTPIFYEWDFGDGISSMDIDPTHTYTATGDYEVTLTARNEFGSDVKSAILPVGILPVVGFTFSPLLPTIGQEVQFTNTTVGTGPLTYTWDFGDGQTSNLENPTYVYNAAGSYPVTLIAENDYGNDTHQGTIKVGIAPKAGFTFMPELPVVGEVVQFTNTTTGTAPITYTWNFGDGITSTLENPQHIYMQPGNYEVTLAAGNDYGSQAEAIVITVIEPVVPVKLGLTLSVSSGPVLYGQAVTITGIVTNQGVSKLEGVMANSFLPEPTTFLEASMGCTVEGKGLVYDVGAIDVGESKVVWVKVIFTKTGPYEISMSVGITGQEVVTTDLKIKVEDWKFLPLLRKD